MADIPVCLTELELQIAAMTGASRYWHVRNRGMKNRPAQSHDDGLGLARHVEGAAGEMALAKALERYWLPSVNAFKVADIGKNIQVRTRTKDEYEMIVRDHDSDDHYFVLVTGTAPEFKIRGYIKGVDAKRDCWKRSYGGGMLSYFVPHAELCAINLKTQCSNG